MGSQTRQGGPLLRRRLLLLLLVPAGGDLSLSGGLVGGAAELGGGFVELLQPLADLVEGRELPPAGPDSAGAGDTVAFAGGVLSGFDYLEETKDYR